MYDLLKHDYVNFVDAEEVTYTDSDGSQTEVKARKTITEQSELKRMGDHLGSTIDLVTFVLWDATMGGKTAKNLGKITRSNGDVYTIQAVLGQEHFETQWRCITRKEL